MSQGLYLSFALDPEMEHGPLAVLSAEQPSPTTQQTSFPCFVPFLWLLRTLLALFAPGVSTGLYQPQAFKTNEPGASSDLGSHSGWSQAPSSLSSHALNSKQLQLSEEASRVPKHSLCHVAFTVEMWDTYPWATVPAPPPPKYQIPHSAQVLSVFSDMYADGLLLCSGSCKQESLAKESGNIGLQYP